MGDLSLGGFFKRSVFCGDFCCWLRVVVAPRCLDVPAVGCLAAWLAYISHRVLFSAKSEPEAGNRRVFFFKWQVGYKAVNFARPSAHPQNLLSVSFSRPV